MSWKNVQYQNGKYRTSEDGGGGGSSTFADLDDVSLSNLQNGQVPKYNSATQKWENANESGGGGTHYSTTEQVIGTWIDGKPLYQKTFHITNLPNQTMVDEPHGISNIGDIIDIRGVCHVKLSIDATNTFTPLPRIQDNNQASQLLAIDVNNTNIRLKGRGFDFTYVFDYVNVTIQYTKTTDV